ncbi:protein serine/threonine kinase, putative [Entamoeba invadens IP1]|uniref:protein serine/threonine kinase, putative n=1 Tax=Entamoeba invadens IP1 TaxID=370355 RepID=UPI0002C3D184|nr:protein serine/threonine kinase, putative [Entamoeba invadens IP1]ELP93825.1 protein serine/threonine kinase, putative [Entamoeba invadens IP1]|eukprot:XP_004260596.1 protein serine/threonine kinase, putative [Entamoeba invadens IP1]
MEYNFGDNVTILINGSFELMTNKHLVFSNMTFVVEFFSIGYNTTFNNVSITSKQTFVLKGTNTFYNTQITTQLLNMDPGAYTIIGTTLNCNTFEGMQAVFEATDSAVNAEKCYFYDFTMTIKTTHIIFDTSCELEFVSVHLTKGSVFQSKFLYMNESSGMFIYNNSTVRTENTTCENCSIEADEMATLFFLFIGLFKSSVLIENDFTSVSIERGLVIHEESEMRLLDSATFHSNTLSLYNTSQLKMYGSATLVSQKLMICDDSIVTLSQASHFKIETGMFTNKSTLVVDQVVSNTILGYTNASGEYTIFGMYDHSTLTIKTPSSDRPIFIITNGSILFGNYTVIETPNDTCAYLAYLNYSSQYLEAATNYKIIYFSYNTNYYLSNGGQSLKYCITALSGVVCVMNGTKWNDVQDSNELYPFTETTCPCHGPQCYIVSNNSEIEIGDYTVEALFLPKFRVFRIIKKIIKKIQIRGFINSIKFFGVIHISPLCPNGTKIFTKLNGTLGLLYFDCLLTDDIPTTPVKLSHTHSTIEKSKIIDFITNNVPKKTTKELMSSILTFDNFTIQIQSTVEVIITINNNKTDNVEYSGNIGAVIYSTGSITVNAQSSITVNAQSNTPCKYGVFKNETNFVCSESAERVCEYGYYASTNQTNCLQCEEHCLSCDSNTCNKCSENYVLNCSGRCEAPRDPAHCISFVRNNCFLCEPYYFLMNKTCTKCPDYCIQCTSLSKCLICQPKYFLLNGTCELLTSGVGVSNRNVVSCPSGYISVNNSCLSCESLSYTNCSMCEKGKCTKCSQDKMYIADQTLCSGNFCSEFVDAEACSKCYECFSLNIQHKCVLKIAHCVTYNMTYCMECEENYTLFQNKCYTADNKCLQKTSERCFRCIMGYYPDVTSKLCTSCSENCSSCLNSTTCLICKDNYYLSSYSCILGKDGSLCLKYTNTGKCIMCSEGYFLSDGGCKQCPKNCSHCDTTTTCSECNKNSFKNSSGECLTRDDIEGCDGNVTLNKGCSHCEDGFYLSNGICYMCNDTCLTCCSRIQCRSCLDKNVLNDGKCQSMSGVLRCIETKDSKCSKCTTFYNPNSDGTRCVGSCPGYLLVLFIFIFIVFAVIIIVVAFLIWKYFPRKIKSENIFTPKGNDVKNFKHKIFKTISCDCEHIDFFGEIPVLKESAKMFNIYNEGSNAVVLNFSSINNKEKYGLVVEPKMTILPKKKACSVLAKITPKCTFTLEEPTLIMICDYTHTKGIYESYVFPVVAATELSTRLNIEEINFETRIGEGNFGTVFKGKYKNKIVAIKTFKIFQQDDFMKEFEMLDKFRCDYIVIFVGVCFDQRMPSIITEFAPFGSLMKCYKKKVSDISLKLKILLDVSRGMEYLHINGILHRDIKPDNILIFSKNHTDLVTAKLSDFGSSRNINLMMTNMTFTKGIGTPTFMAPEILKMEKYNIAADVYSFAMLMLSVVKWGKIFTDPEFKFPWKIAKFISSGKRPEIPKDLHTNLKSLIERCWNSDQRIRPTFNTIVSELKCIYDLYNV